MKIKYYRDKKSGAMIEPTMRGIKAARKNVVSMRFPIPDAFLARLSLEPVFDSEPPEIDGRYDRLVESVVLEGGARRVAYSVVPIHETLDDLRAAIIGEARGEANTRRAAGITVAGIFLRTDDAAVARLNGAVIGDKATRDFVVGDQVFKLSRAQIKGMHTAVDDYLQGCYTREAELIGAIKSSNSPKTIDIKTGWPANG